MTRIGLYTATENELGSVQRAASRLDGIDLVVRSEGDLDDQTDVEAFVDDCADATAVVFWLHGGEDSMPGYEYAVDRLRELGVPLIVKGTGDAFAFEDTSVADADRDQIYAYLERGGTINVEHCCRFLASEYGGVDTEYDEPTELPTEGVYHPDHPGIEYDALRETFDPEKPTVAIWFYESHWTHENTRYVDAQVRALESQGARTCAST